jgi:hypothetical protein
MHRFQCMKIRRGQLNKLTLGVTKKIVSFLNNNYFF